MFENFRVILRLTPSWLYFFISLNVFCTGNEEINTIYFTKSDLKRLRFRCQKLSKHGCKISKRTMFWKISTYRQFNINLRQLKSDFMNKVFIFSLPLKLGNFEVDEGIILRIKKRSKIKFNGRHFYGLSDRFKYVFQKSS